MIRAGQRTDKDAAKKAERMHLDMFVVTNYPPRDTFLPVLPITLSARHSVTLNIVTLTCQQSIYLNMIP